LSREGTGTIALQIRHEERIVVSGFASHESFGSVIGFVTIALIPREVTVVVQAIAVQ